MEKRGVKTNIYQKREKMGASKREGDNGTMVTTFAIR